MSGRGLPLESAARGFAEADAAVALAAETPAPAEAGEPRFWLRRRPLWAVSKVVFWRSIPRGPVREPPRGAAWVERRGAGRCRGRRGSRAVLAVIEENVDQRVADFARRRQRVAMMAIAKQLPMAAR